LQATTQFKLADSLNAVHKWIKSARVLDSTQRIALVRAREGLSLEVTLTTGTGGKNSAQEGMEGNDGQNMGGEGEWRQQPIEERQLIHFVHNSSRLADFTAMLIIDRFSNSLLNLTVKPSHLFFT
jgi:hypothetical protein